MRFALTEDRVSLVDAVTQFLSKELPPDALRSWLGDSDAPDYRDWWRQCAAMGWSGLFAPPGTDDYDAVSDEPLVDAALVAELAGRALAPSALNGVSATMSALAADRGIDRLDTMTRLLDGSAIAAYAIEESAGRPPWHAAVTRARRDGDEVVVSGAKINVADVSSAEQFLVACTADDGPALVIVAADAPGVTTVSRRGLDLLREYGKVRFDDVRLPAAALVTGNSSAADGALRVATCLQLAETVGAVDRLVDMTVDYARNRYAFGRPIGSFQALKHRIADLVLWTETCKGTTDVAIDAVAAGDGDADFLVSVAKAYVGDYSVRIAQESTQMFGGIGLTWEHDAHLYLRRITVNRSLLGSPTQHRARVAAEFDITADEGAPRV